VAHRAPRDREGEGRACRFIVETGGGQAQGRFLVLGGETEALTRNADGAAPPR